jgi:uncharacterized small protein (DUF1192 family)
MTHIDLTALGRSELINRIASLDAELHTVKAESVELRRLHDVMLLNLTEVQTRCTALLEEKRELADRLREALNVTPAKGADF